MNNNNNDGKLNVRTKTEMNANEAHLASLFANRDDGQDTFGNIGALRFVFLFLLFSISIFRLLIRF